MKYHNRVGTFLPHPLEENISEHATLGRGHVSAQDNEVARHLEAQLFDIHELSQRLFDHAVELLRLDDIDESVQELGTLPRVFGRVFGFASFKFDAVTSRSCR